LIGSRCDQIDVLHVIPCLTPGGASRAMAALAARQAAAGVGVRILSLTPSHPAGRALLGGLVDIADGLGMDAALSELAGAEIVHVHAWNVPELYDVLRRALPPLRLVVWFHVAGRALPQVIPTSLVSRADIAVASCREAYEHILAANVPGALPPGLVIPAPELGNAIDPTPHRSPDLTIGYVGTLDEYKLCPDVMHLCARVEVPGARFVFAGDGPMRRRFQQQAETIGLADRVRFLGWVADVRPVIASFDIFGYPMSSDSYATADLAVMEAMAAGVPPVVLSPWGRHDAVQDLIDGLVVTTADDYVAALNRLGRDSQTRQALACAARAVAPVRFDPGTVAAAFADIYRAVLQRPKRPRAALGGDRVGGATPFSTRGAEALLFAFDGRLPALETSLASRGRKFVLADAEIADAGRAWLGAWIGGLLHYLARYPGDPWLMFWRALSFAGNDLPVRALACLERSRAAGFPDPARTDAYRAILLSLLREPQSAETGVAEGCRFSRAVQAQALAAAS
jgi:glycosyltransferase involved in cell wall biosynthesis